MRDENDKQLKEALLVQALKTQRSILELLDHTLYDTYQSEKRRPKEEQNEELLHLAQQIRTIVAKKPKLKEIYRRLEEEFELKL